MFWVKFYPDDVQKVLFAKSIIEYQEKNHLTDADFSLESHRSVERIHALKTMEAEPTNDEYREITAVINGQKLD